MSAGLTPPITAKDLQLWVGFKRGPRSKIQQLDEDLQNRIIALLAAGKEYQLIIEMIEDDLPDGVELTINNLSKHWLTQIKPALERREQKIAALKEWEHALGAEEQIDVAHIASAQLSLLLLDQIHELEQHLAERKANQSEEDPAALPDEDTIKRLRQLTSMLRELDQAGKLRQEREEKIREGERKKVKEEARQAVETVAVGGLGLSTQAKQKLLDELGI